jgi:tetratricopeptide (TPR) repeat protein
MSILPLLIIGTALAVEPHWEPGVEGAVDAYNRGVEALEAGDPVVAERQLRKALRKDPGCGMCSYALSSALLRQDRAVEAMVMAAGVCERFPGALEPALLLADAAFAAERFDESIKVSERLLLAHPDSWDSLTILVRGLIRTGDTARARAALQQATAHHGDEQLACELGKVALEEQLTSEARDHLARCQQADLPAVAAALESRILHQEGEHEQAGELLAEDTDPLLIAQYQANALLEAGDHQGAAAILRVSVTARPEDAESAVLLGLCEYHLGDHEAARVALERAFEGKTWITVGSRGGLAGILTASGERAFRQHMREGVARLVMLQAEDGRLKDARETLERAKEEQGPSGELTAAEVQLLCMQERHAEAAAAAVRGLLRWPDSSLLLHTAGYLGTNHPEARSPELERALALAGEWRALYNGAVELQNTGEHASCLARLEAAPAFDEPEAQATIARLAHSCAASAEQLDAAERWLTRAGGAAAVQPYALFNHARLLLGANRLEDALGLIQAAEPGPDGDPEAVAYLHSMALDIHVRLGELEPALTLYEQGAADPIASVNLAILLANSQRAVEALPILRQACPGLTEPDERAACEDLLADMEAHAGE